MTRKEREKRVVRAMIGLYCRRHHGGGAVLCAECRELADYACARIDACALGSAKSTCRLCATHCYAPSKREAIRRVMRYAGPRMMRHHPVMALRHLLNELYYIYWTGRQENRKV